MGLSIVRRSKTALKEIMDTIAKQSKFIRSCSIWRALEAIGDRPTLLIMQSYWFGARRFHAYQKQTGLAKTLLSDRLRQLVETGFFNRIRYQEHPERFEYRGTQKLHDVFNIALAMLYWESHYGAGQHLKLRHLTCGRESLPIPSCSACKRQIDARAVTWEQGPGTGFILATHTRRRTSSTKAKTKRPETAMLDQAINIFGDRSSVLVLRALFTGHRTFNKIQADCLLSTNILIERINRLAEQGILHKEPHTETGPGRDYRLTEAGIALYPILVFLMHWGDKYYASPEGPPMVLTHKCCGRELVPALLCSCCGKPVRLGELALENPPAHETEQS